MGEPTKLYLVVCDKIHFPKQQAFEERRGWQIDLFDYSFKQKNALSKHRKELGKWTGGKDQISWCVRGTADCEWGYRSPVKHVLRGMQGTTFLLRYRDFLDTTASQCCLITVQWVVWKKGMIKVKSWSPVAFLVPLAGSCTEPPRRSCQAAALRMFLHG